MIRLSREFLSSGGALFSIGRRLLRNGLYLFQALTDLIDAS